MTTEASSSKRTNIDKNDHQQSFNNVRTYIPFFQSKFSKQIKYDHNQNQTQSSPITSVEESSNVNKQHTYGRQHLSVNLLSEFVSYNVTFFVVIAWRKNNNQTNRAIVSQGQTQNNGVAIHVKELTSEHLEELKTAFDKILNEQFLSKVDLEQYLYIYHHLRDIILAKRPDAQIILYGSLLFECCLKETNIIDIDVQFNETLPYETLKELLEILRNSGLVYYKKAFINIDREPLSIDLSILNSNILVRLTSNYTRAIQLSEIVQIYTKFDERVLLLLRLFRNLSKICNIDRSDLGTLHPIVFHFMIIHFLQQLDPPVLPCLHEYVFGIDKAPISLNNDQYANFFQICTEYTGRWKSKNTTSIEMLFLQLLSYYVQEFNTARFIISIQTRMPLLKNEKQILNGKLFCADPTNINGNLCYTMNSSSSSNYFQCTLKAVLNYFCQRPKHENIPIKQLVETINKSYTLFIERFPKKIKHWTNLQQEDIRYYYKQTFDNIENPLPEPILRLNENDDELDTIVIDHVANEFTSQNELQSIDKEEPVLFETFSKHLNENQKKILRKEYDEQVRIFNNTMQQILNGIQSSSTTLPSDAILDESPIVPHKVKQVITTNSTSSINYPESFYDIQAKNFGAEKGAPSVCTICYKSNHIKPDCPELSVPNIIDLPIINREWINIVSHICRQVTDTCKSNKNDIKIREEILKYLQVEFEKYYPSCSVHAYGSSNNGFGFRQSDLDVCVILKDNNEESNIVILEKLSRIMKSNLHMLNNVEFVRNARIPIIRSIHSQFSIEIDISLHNNLAMENTRLLKTYAEIDSRVSELGYMIKHLVKICDIGDASTGTLSSYAYIIMVVHFLQQIHPPVLPVLQQLTDNSSKKNGMIHRQCNKWNVYFYDNLSKLKQVWMNKNGPNTMTIGELWIQFLRYYTEQFDYEKNVVTIRQVKPLRRYEKGWFHQTIAIEDPFILTHNLAAKLSVQKWSLIRRVFIRARQQFCLQPKDIDIRRFTINGIQKYLFDINTLCPENVDKLYKSTRKSKSIVNRTYKKQNAESLVPLMQVRVPVYDFRQNRTITWLLIK